MAEIIQLPENGGNSGVGNIPFSIPLGGFGGFGNGFGGGFGYGMNGIADLFGLAIIASMFGWNGGNGFGGWGGGNNGQLGFLANQLNNDSGRELIMNAVTSQGEANRSAVQSLANAIGQDFNLVNSGVQNVQNALQSLALQQAVSVPQIINSLQLGNQTLAQQFQNCCCEQKLLTTEQGYQAQIRTIEQTGTLSNQANVNTAQIRADIAQQTTFINEKFCDLEKRELQSKIDTQADIITQLRNAADNANQTNQIIGYVNSVVSPLQTKVNEIASKQLPTVPVVYPNIQAVNNTPYNGGYGFWGNGFGNSIVF